MVNSPLSKSLLCIVAAVGFLSFPACGHDVITTRLTWTKEVSRVVFKRCGGCHRPEGKAFSLLTYAEARPWAKAMQEEVLRRRMPPWNAVKGFGEFRHDHGLSEEEIHLLADWVEGGAPEGDPNLLPPLPRAEAASNASWPGIRIAMRGSLRLKRALELTAIALGRMEAGMSFKLVGELPDGSRVPLLWIEEYSAKANQLYELKQPLRLAAGTRIVAYPDAGVSLTLISTGSVPQR